MTSPLSRTPGTAAPIGAPWFVQFWPVFIAALMVISVAASLATVAIAYRHADVDVRSAEGIADAGPEAVSVRPVGAGRAGDGSAR